MNQDPGYQSLHPCGRVCETPSQIHASFGSTKGTRGVKATPCPSRNHFSRRDRNPCPRPTPPSLQWFVSHLCSRTAPCTSAAAQEGKKTLTLLLLLLGLLGSGALSSSSSAASRRGSSSTTARADRGEEVLHILALESLQCSKVPVSQSCSSRIPCAVPPCREFFFPSSVPWRIMRPR